MLHSFKLLGLAALLILFAVPTNAQSWPNRPITAIVPFAAGGPVDIVGRILAQQMAELLGQQIVVENPGGAGGMTGTARVVKSAPDGYTILIASAGVLALNQTLYKRPLYNASTDLEPVALFSDTGRVLIVNKDFQASNLTEFIAYAKANHGKMSYGSAGAGSGTHVCAILLDLAMGTKITHVPYRGASLAMGDLIGGRIDFIAEQVASALPQIQGGNVKAIATLGAERAPGLENLPTAKELGINGLDCGSWNALAVPKGTPEAIVRRLAQASSDAIDAPAVIERFKSIGVTVTPKDQRSPQYLGRYIASEIERWAVPIKSSGVTVE
ncbi:MAG: tripartite tricarboxylate transporter substrate-binding protein [Hyphomicrobiales bacterium]